MMDAGYPRANRMVDCRVLTSVYRLYFHENSIVIMSVLIDPSLEQYVVRL